MKNKIENAGEAGWLQNLHTAGFKTVVLVTNWFVTSKVEEDRRIKSILDEQFVIATEAYNCAKEVYFGKWDNARQWFLAGNDFVTWPENREVFKDVFMRSFQQKCNYKRAMLHKKLALSIGINRIEEAPESNPDDKRE